MYTRRYDIKERLEGLGFSDASVLCESGIYVLGWGGEIMWVGQSKRLVRRIGDQCSNFNFDSIYVIPVPEVDLDTVEGFLILKLEPRYNRISPFDPYHRPYARRELIGDYNQAKFRRISDMMRILEATCNEEDSLLKDDINNWYPELTEVKLEGFGE